jgi:hypothetical protein
MPRAYDSPARPSRTGGDPSPGLHGLRRGRRADRDWLRQRFADCEITLSRFVGDHGGHDPARFRSFERYRRNLVEPEVVTFDELLARAEWLVETAEDADSYPVPAS